MTADQQITRRRPAGDTHEVVTVEGPHTGYRRRPCPGCPWRLDQTGTFPPEAFVHSAPTAYDMADHTFACHEHGVEHPLTCAGFLLRNSVNNLAVRIGARPGGRFHGHLEQVHDGGHALHPSYRAMAEANGVPADHPALRPCRGDDQ